ncbi:hypothetical protein LTR85_010134 [Meristemomyces frigidus]|nr:hypothetical protein LTR85_010134 [Meristemomyces frigidus]
MRTALMVLSQSRSSLLIRHRLSTTTALVSLRSGTSARSFASFAPFRRPDVTNTPLLSSQDQEELDISEVVMDRDESFNDAADLARQLAPYHGAGCKSWGFVIYRCTYASDSAWEHFLDVLNARTRRSLREYSYPELYDTLSWSIESDDQTLNGASKDFVRERFRDWVEREIADLSIAPGHEGTVRWNPKFRYCIHADEGVLKSVVDDAPQPPAPDLDGVAYVNLVAKDSDEQEAKYDGEKDLEVDGQRMYDVGWMKMAVDGLAPRAYSLFACGGDTFSDLYERPPAVAIP